MSPKVMLGANCPQNSGPGSTDPDTSTGLAALTCITLNITMLM